MLSLMSENTITEEKQTCHTKKYLWYDNGMTNKVVVDKQVSNNCLCLFKELEAYMGN